MHPGQVVVLHEVLADELVVGVDVVGEPALRDPLVEPVVAEARRQVAQVHRQGRGVRVEVDEQEQAPGVDGDVVEPVVGLVEALGDGGVEDRLLAGGDVGALEQRRAEAVPVGVVGPRVVRAADAPAVADLAGVARQQLRRTVAADVVERAQRAVAVARHDHRSACDVDDDARAVPVDVGGEADRDPARREDLLLLEREELRRGVRVGQQGGGELDGAPGGGVRGLVGVGGRVDGTCRESCRGRRPGLGQGRLRHGSSAGSSGRSGRGG